MPDIDIAGVDLTVGLKPNNLVVPVMQVEVVRKSPPAELLKAVKDDKLILQKIEVAAFTLPKQARDAH